MANRNRNPNEPLITVLQKAAEKKEKTYEKLNALLIPLRHNQSETGFMWSKDSPSLYSFVYDISYKTAPSH